MAQVLLSPSQELCSNSTLQLIQFGRQARFMRLLGSKTSLSLELALLDSTSQPTQETAIRNTQELGLLLVIRGLPLLRLTSTNLCTRHQILTLVLTAATQLLVLFTTRQSVFQLTTTLYSAHSRMKSLQLLTASTRIIGTTMLQAARVLLVSVCSHQCGTCSTIHSTRITIST